MARSGASSRARHRILNVTGATGGSAEVHASPNDRPPGGRQRASYRGNTVFFEPSVRPAPENTTCASRLGRRAERALRRLTVGGDPLCRPWARHQISGLKTRDHHISDCARPRPSPHPHTPFGREVPPASRVFATVSASPPTVQISRATCRSAQPEDLMTFRPATGPSPSISPRRA